MENQTIKLESLLRKLDALILKQASFKTDLTDLKKELTTFKIEQTPKPEIPVKEVIPEVKNIPVLSPPPPPKPVVSKPEPIFRQTTVYKENSSPSFFENIKTNSDLEKFLGENLAGKIGILITILGVAIGAKYAIDNEIISPMVRIILGYMMGTGLVVFALRFKEKYEQFSAILLSGGMTIYYFITYFGYDLYGLFPQWVAFGMMFLFTGFTVLAALHYNRQIIAGLGLVGAYAVPFLLSNNSGNVLFLFSYMTITNVGILVIAFRKNWRTIFHAAFYLSWAIFMTWQVGSYSNTQHFGIGMTFSTVFFLIFYLTFLGYKVTHNELMEFKDVFLILLNTTVYFSVGYLLISEHGTEAKSLGLFAAFNGFLHFIIARFLHYKDLDDKNLFYLVAGLALTFFTLAVPIQFDGSWVTGSWVAGAALLFWIGRTKGTVFYEKLSFALMILATGSLLQDWGNWTPDFQFYPFTDLPTPFLNSHFLTGLTFLAAFGFIQKTAWDFKNQNPFNESEEPIFYLHKYFIPIVLGGVLFNTFLIEILTGFENQYFLSASSPNDFNPILDQSILEVRNIWVLNYCLLFLSGLAFLNIKKIKHQGLGHMNLFVNILGILVFLLGGLYFLSEVRENCLANLPGRYYDTFADFQLLRYCSLAVFAFFSYTTVRLVKAKFVDLHYPKVIETGIYFIIVWVLSSELLHWTDILDAKNSYKLALSILWGIGALVIIWIGIREEKQYLRWGGISLFGVTLIKLFFYDIAHLNAISKTIVLVSLGVLLLVISFLYNKFKEVIFEEID